MLAKNFGRGFAFRITLSYLPLAILLVGLAAFLVYRELTAQYEEDRHGRQLAELDAAQFTIDSYLADIRRQAMVIAENIALVNAVKENDSVVASLALQKVLQSENIEYGFILGPDGRSVLSRSHNPLVEYKEGSDPFARAWAEFSRPERSAVRKAFGFLMILGKELADKERPGITGESDELLYLASMPIVAFGDTIGLLVIGKDLGRDPLLQTRLQSLLQINKDQSKAFALISKGQRFQALGRFQDNEGKAVTESSDWFTLRRPFAGDTEILLAADQSEFFERTEKSLIFVLTVIILLALAFASLSRILLANVLRPVHALARSIQNTASGHLLKVDDEGRDDEVSLIGKRFNAIVDGIDSSLQNQNLLLELGQLISSQDNLDTLSAAIQSAARLLVHSEVKVLVSFKDHLYAPALLEAGFYTVEGAREKIPTLPPESPTMARIGISSLNGSALLAQIYIIIDDDETLRRGQNLMSKLAVNVASAIDSMRLGTAMSLINQKTREIDTIFDNINQGICQIDAECQIVGEYSKYLEKIIGQESLKGKSIFQTIFRHSGNRQRDEFRMIKGIIEGSVGEDALNFLVNRHHLPRELQRFVGHEMRVMELDWSALMDHEDRVLSIMLTVRDVTLLRQLREEAANQTRESQMLMRILSLPQAKVSDALREAKRYLNRLGDLPNRELTAGEITECKRHLHSLKGLALSLDWKDAAEDAHKSEEKLLDMLIEDGKSTRSILEENFRKELAELIGSFQDYAAIFHKYLSGVSAGSQFDPLFQSLVAFCEEALERPHEIARQSLLDLGTMALSARNSSVKNLLNSFDRSLGNMARELALPKPTLTVSGPDLIFAKETSDILLGVFGHLFRNSMVHAFQWTPLDAGRIFVELMVDDDFAQLVYVDSGRGLDMQKLQDKGRALGLALDDDQAVAELIFRPDVSTAAVVNPFAGRAIGLDAVKSYVESCGGHTDLILQGNGEFRPFQIRLNIPVELVLNQSFLLAAGSTYPRTSYWNEVATKQPPLSGL